MKSVKSVKKKEPLKYLQPKTELLQLQSKSNLLVDNNLPQICTPRHYLFHTKNVKDLGFSLSYEQQKMLGRKDSSLGHKATIYNIEFRKKIRGSKTISHDPSHYYSQNPSLNKTVLKPRRENVRWKITNLFKKDGSKVSLTLSELQGKLKSISSRAQMGN